MARDSIFFSYRRDDTADVAGRIYDAFAARFGRARLFKDVDSIPPGADFGAYIKGILPGCRVALVLIGPHWAEARDAQGARRLDDPADWVRIEIETALAQDGVHVVPVLINGAQLPRAEDLPESLQPLLRRNAAVVRRDPDFRDDVERLMRALGPDRRRLVLAASAAAAVLTVGALGVSMLVRPTSPAVSGDAGGEVVAEVDPAEVRDAPATLPQNTSAPTVRPPTQHGGSGSQPQVGPEPGSLEDWAHWIGDGRVYFAIDRASLDDGMQSALNEQAAWLNRYPQYRVRVIGHAADEGIEGGTSRQYAIRLSERRANVVRDYLTSVGVSAGRIVTMGVGLERPLAQGTSAEANARNRHVQVVPYVSDEW